MRTSWRRLRERYGALWGRQRTSALREVVETVVVAVTLALLIRYFIVQAFFIPSSSMEDTLLIDDHVLVNRFIYRFSDPQRGDIIVFVYPGPGEAKDYIKRVIGCPGDTVAVRGGLVYVNGTELTEPYAIHRGVPRQLTRDEYGPVHVPRDGETVQLAGLTDDAKLAYRELCRQRGEELRWVGAQCYLDNRPVTELTVTGAWYFVMGDNRDNSADSRFWGFMPRPNLLGKAFCIYWPFARLGPIE